MKTACFHLTAAARSLLAAACITIVLVPPLCAGEPSLFPPEDRPSPAAGPEPKGGSIASGTASPDAPGGATDASPADLPYKYVGNKFSSRFHRPSCAYARAMSLRNVELFHFRKDAVAAGHSPCRYCLPQVWRQVRARLLPPAGGQRPPLAAEPLRPAGVR